MKDIIIDTISDIRQPIATIAHSKTSEDPKFRNLFYFPKGDPILFDFPKTYVGGSEPLEPPDTNPPINSIPSPQPNFNFGGNMEANQSWLTIDDLAIPGAPRPLPKPPENLFPKFDPDKDVLP
jgi:hypothetical protein